MLLRRPEVGDGRLFKSEFATALRSVGMNPTDDTAERLWDEALAARAAREEAEAEKADEAPARVLSDTFLVSNPLDS